MPSSASSGPEVADGADLLAAHLTQYLGAWPSQSAVDVVPAAQRGEPAWDGNHVPLVAVRSPQGTVISVEPSLVEAVSGVVAETGIMAPGFRAALATAIDRPGRVSPWVVVRWSTAPAALPEEGVWLDSADPVVPDWLHPFPGRVLAALDADGRYLAGVGIKRHTDVGHELAVGTDEAARGRGLARRLVAQAARAVLAEGALPLYVHAADNEPSARVADAAGFPDRGWRLLAVWG